MFSKQTCIYLTHSVCTKSVYLRKRSYNWLSPRLCIKIKKYWLLHLNTTVSSLI